MATQTKEFWPHQGPDLLFRKPCIVRRVQAEVLLGLCWKGGHNAVEVGELICVGCCTVGIGVHLIQRGILLVQQHNTTLQLILFTVSNSLWNVYVHCVQAKSLKRNGESRWTTAIQIDETSACVVFLTSCSQRKVLHSILKAEEWWVNPATASYQLSYIQPCQNTCILQNFISAKLLPIVGFKGQ